MDIILLEGKDLVKFYNYLGVELPPEKVYRVRVAFDGGGFKVKHNEAMWSPPFGVAEQPE